jgi:hypothetical protein
MIPYWPPQEAEMDPQANGDNDEVVSSVKASASGLNPYLKLLNLALTLLRRLSPGIQIALALLGLIIAVYYANRLSHRLIDGQEVVTKALNANLETTAHPHKGIAAFLLSGIDKELPPDQQIQVGERLRSNLTNIETKLQKLTDEAKTFNADQALSSLQLEVTNPKSAAAWQKAIIAKDSPDKFLMVPAISLRRQGLTEPPLNNEELGTVLKQNPEVLFDLEVASKLEPDFRSLDEQASIQSLQVVQTYFITESGVIRLHASNVGDQTGYYRDQFSAQTLFMDRPYFWGAVHGASQANAYGPFDFRTEPYIDLGGNGLVETYSRKLQLPNNRAAVICLDVKLPRSSIELMKKRLTTLGAVFGDFYWTVDQVNAEGIPDDFTWFVEDVKASNNRKEQSRFVGGVAMENEQPQPTSATQPDVLRFTVPLESSQGSNNLRRTRLLWVRVDFAANRTSLTRDLIMFLVGTIMVVLLSWTMFLEYNVLGREMTGVLKKMTKVMHEASTPFAWLDDKNSFVDVNQAFLRILEYKNIEDLKHERATFRSLISAESQPDYDKVLEKSRSGRETGKYTVKMVTGKRRILHVVVHGERVPYPTFLKRSLPHRFGVFLSVFDPEKRSEQTDVKREDEASAKVIF